MFTKPIHRLTIGIIVGVIIAFPLGAFAGKTYFARWQMAISKPTASGNNFLIKEGFDFDSLRKPDNDWAGPKIGEKIDLTRLKTMDGTTLATEAGGKPFMIASINPDCGMCRIATDEMIHLRNKLSGMKVQYYLVFFAYKVPEADFFKYADSLKVGARSFLWNAEGGPPAESIFKMNSPSHLLLAGDGTVIRVWPGSYNDKSVRQRMAQQILADTSVVLDTMNSMGADRH